MSAPAFTPWTASVEKRYAPARGHWYVVLDEDENGIGEFYGEDHDANVANLRLAAAAPELYEALELAIEPLEIAWASKQALWDAKHSECSNVWRVGVLREIDEAKRALTGAQSALAKARGEA